MSRRSWQRNGKTKGRKLVTVFEKPWELDWTDSVRINPEEEKLKARAEEIRLRNSGFVFKNKQPKIVINNELLKGKIFFVDCQLNKSEQNDKVLSRKEITEGVVSQLQKLGATVNYVIFMNGRYSTFQSATKLSIPMLSSGWIEESKKQNALASTEKFAASVPSNFHDPIAPRKYKRKYTIEHLEKLKQDSERRKKHKDVEKPKEDSKKPAKKHTEKPSKTEQSSKKSSSKDKKASKLSTSSRKSEKSSSSKKDSSSRRHQENTSPSTPSKSRSSRRSVSIEVVKVGSSERKSSGEKTRKSKSPTRKRESTSNEVTTPIKRIRVESISMLSPLATPPRLQRPQIEQIAVSNLTAEQYKKLSEAVEKLGRFVIARAAKEGVTHVVWGSGRTINLLRGIALGCRVLSFQWVEESVKQGKWLPEDEYVAPPYVEVDKEIQRLKKCYGSLFSCQLLRAMGPIYVNSAVKSAKPEDLRTLVQLSGGTLVHNLQDAKLVIGPPPDKLILSTTTYVKENWIYSVLCNYKIKPIKPFLYESKQM